MRGDRRRRAGYTLIELVVTMGIIGVVAAAASIEAVRFTARSKRAEAIVSMGQIWDAQQTNYGEFGSYRGDFDELGFELAGGQRIAPNILKGRYYTFTLSQPWGNGSFYCTASANIDDDPWPDILVIADGADELSSGS